MGNGTAESPIFVRGVGADDMPVFSGSTKPVRPEGSYIIMENLDLQRWVDIRPKTDMADPIHHVVLRHCDLHDFECTAVHIGWLHGLDSHPEWRDPTLVTDVVLYDNRIYSLGDWEQTGSSEDHAGVFPHINTLRLWILDNEIYHVDGDGIQINTWGIYDDPDIHLPPRLVYIGRNAVYECQENDLDFKVCQDVIVSQNAIYGIHDHSVSSDGTAVVVHEDSGTATFPRPERLWYLFNEIYDNDIGFRIQDSEDVYVIGNTFHDMISSYALLDSGYSSGAAIQCWDNGTIHVVNNTIYNCDLGILSANNNGMLLIVNNVIADLSDSFLATFGTPAYHIFINVAAVADASEMHHNLLHQTGGSIRIRWDGIHTTLAAFQAGTGQGAECLEADPQFVAAGEGDFHLAPTSPVVDAGTVYAAYQTFLDLYGIDIDVDYEGVARPAPPTDVWDLGAFERTPG